MLRFFNNQKRHALWMEGLESEYIDGEWIPCYADPIDLLIIVPQPVSSNEVRQLEEGESRRNFRKTWCTRSVKSRDGEWDSDVFIYRGRWYKIFGVDDWSQLGNYYQSFIREDPPPWAAIRRSDNTVMLTRGTRRPILLRSRLERGLE